MNLCDWFEMLMQYVNYSPHQQGYGLRPWYEEEKELTIVLAHAIPFLIQRDCICTFGCLTRQVEVSRREASFDNGDLH